MSTIQHPMEYPLTYFKVQLTLQPHWQILHFSTILTSTNLLIMWYAGNRCKITSKNISQIETYWHICYLESCYDYSMISPRLINCEWVEVGLDQYHSITRKNRLNDCVDLHDYGVYVTVSLWSEENAKVNIAKPQTLLRI